jgi:hypothetical protein
MQQLTMCLYMKALNGLYDVYWINFLSKLFIIINLFSNRFGLYVFGQLFVYQKAALLVQKFKSSQGCTLVYPGLLPSSEKVQSFGLKNGLKFVDSN